MYVDGDTVGGVSGQDVKAAHLNFTTRF